MKKIIIILLVICFVGGSLFAEETADILNLKKEMKKQQTGMLIAMTVIVVAIIAPVAYEGLRIIKDK